LGERNILRRRRIPDDMAHRECFVSLANLEIEGGHKSFCQLAGAGELASLTVATGYLSSYDSRVLDLYRSLTGLGCQ
jgi:hypothetical protein